MAGNLVDALGMTQGGTVDAHLVGTGVEHTIHVRQVTDTSTHGEGDIDGGGYTGNHIGESLASLMGGRDV